MRSGLDHALESPDAAHLDTRTRDTAARGRVLPAGAAVHAEPARHCALRGRRDHRLARRLARAALGTGLGLRRVPRPGRRQADRLCGAGDAGRAEPRRCGRRGGDRRARAHDLGAARMDGPDGRARQRRGALDRQVQDRGATGRDSDAALRRAHRRPVAHARAWHLADLGRSGADGLVDALLPAAGLAGAARWRSARWPGLTPGPTAALPAALRQAPRGLTPRLAGL